VDDLLSEWLNYDGTTADMDQSFWSGPSGAISKFADNYLDLLLQAITQGGTKLANAIKSQMKIASAKDLASKKATDWQNFFAGSQNSELLPDFTLPGNVKQRTSVFIQLLQKFFTVTDYVLPPPSGGGGQTSGFDLPAGDVLQKFFTKYACLFPHSTFSFAALPDKSALDKTIKAVLPTDEEGRKWLRGAIDTIAFLVNVTSINPSNETLITAQFQFSLIEALYARGFTRLEQIQNLTQDQFYAALVGTVACAKASLIYNKAFPPNATQLMASVNEADAFAPVNADQTLVNCLPPPNLSPLGQTAYLHDLLALPLGDTTLGQLIATRRGPLQTLHPTTANLASILPCIDLVNESLEALGSSLQVSKPHGAVYNTSDAAILARNLDVEPKNAAGLLDAVPEYSSPAKPASPGVYAELAKCFTDAGLPYSQGLDVCSSNLSVLGTTRFDTMRHFRRDVTELAMDAALEPGNFQKHLWRYPVRLEIALAYLNISPEEYSMLFCSTQPDAKFLESVLGLKAEALQNNFFTVKRFLEFTGLTYGEFLQFHRCGYVPFKAAQSGVNDKADSCFPQPGMNDLGRLHVHFDASDAEIPFTLRKAFVFIRLWRCLCRSNPSKTGFGGLKEVCTMLGLFKHNTVNRDFLRQLAALLMLQNHFHIPIEELTSLHHHSRPRNGSCFAIWSEKGPGSAEWDLAVELLLEKIQEYALERYRCRSREVGFRKDLKDNLHQLSLLAGFTDTDKWHAQPTSTIRFAEVLAKVYASDFTVGEVIFLFTTEEHAPGSDPFPMPDALESIISPLNIPDNDDDYNIWALREKLIGVDIDEGSQIVWDWSGIQSALIGMGYEPCVKNDPVTALGEHFFHGALEESGHPVGHRCRRFEVALPASDTTVSLWGADQRGPFQYDTEGSCLWTELPLCEEAVLDKLKSTRQLNEKEINAVQELYFAPRATLAPFAFIFDNFPAALNRLIHEPSDKARFEFFQKQFALFHRRCEIIADHLASHVATASGNKAFDRRKVAWQVLRRISADENRPRVQPWETDSGASPDAYTWDRHLSGSSFSALLGLTGTGLLGEYEIQHGSGSKKVWRETTGDLTFFGDEQDKANVPVPTILPPLNLEPEARQKHAIEVVNGFALRDSDERCLGGAQPFRVCWSGALLVDASGEYTFHVGSPRPGGESPHFDGTKHQRWLVVLRRGQKSWTIINHAWDAPAAPPAISHPFVLQRGVWHIEIWFEQRQPLTASHHPLHTGFQAKYKGPDTGDTLSVMPVRKLFRDSKQETLAHGLELKSSASAYLNKHYYSTLRDIRRTYQRAFKAILLVSRYHLSAEPHHHDQYGESELEFLLRHPASFLGTSYYRVSGPKPAFLTHHAFFDLNLLPVSDPYHSPVTNRASEGDARSCPSKKREAALFDWWERLHDYTHLRTWVRDVRSRHAWMLFYEAAEQAPKADKLLRYLSISVELASAVLTYFDDPSKSFAVDTPDLTDERWTIRVWRAGMWLDELKRRFWTPCLGTALPWLWASDDPNAVIGGMSGNKNLTRFVQRSHFEQAAPALEGIQELNNGLRLRARKALLAYLCGGDRVALPFSSSSWAKVPRDLSDLLLQDVGVEIHEKTTRIEDAISTAQSFVQRVRLGLEPQIQPASNFIEVWDAKYSTFKTWKPSKLRELYPENRIYWDELRSARKSDSFRSLEKALRGGVLTIPKQSSSMPWSDTMTTQLPKDSPLTDLQSLEHVSLTTSGSSLLGYPEYSGQLSLIAPLLPSNDYDQTYSTQVTYKTTVTNGTTPAAQPLQKEPLPLWMKAAVDMGVSFIQVAAATGPVAITPTRDSARWCNTCEKIHAPHIDEFYFWLTPARYFNSRDALKNLDFGATPPDPSCSWDPIQRKLKDLLKWGPRPIFYLSWCRVHCGRFDASRQSDAGTAPGGTGTGTPSLAFVGRKADSLLFSVDGVETFIYDVSRDYTSSLTDAVMNDVESVPDGTTVPSDTIDTSQFAAPLTAFPFFIHFEPGAPVIPISNLSTSVSVASALSSHGHYQEALKWYELAFDSPRSPLLRNNSWEQSSTSTPAVTRGRAVLLEYLEALQQWGETLSGQPGAESCREALVIFNLIDKIMGCHPAMVVPKDTTSASMTIENFAPSAIPLNPRLMALYDGVAESLAQLRQGDGLTISTYSTTLHLPHRRHPYRFSYLLQKAMELADAARSLGSALLSALERGDSEYLSSVQTNHERQLLNLSLPGKKEQFRAADWDVQALENSLKKGLCDLNYYLTLIRNGYNAGETGFLNSTQLGLAEGTAAEGTMAAGEGVSSIPDVYAGGAGVAGSPLEFQKVTGGSSLASALSFASNILKWQAESMNTIANMQLTQSGWARRLDEWTHTVDMDTIDLKALECQKLAADRRRDIALYELNATVRQIEHAAEVADFTRDKASGFDTYLFLQRETALLYRQTFGLALAAARDAQDMLRYELRDPVHTEMDFVEQHSCAWQNLRDGLLAGDKLALALRAMDRAYTESNVREYELTKQLSLSMQFPAAFLQLKATGSAEFAMPEWMFDLDYPGMYMRRIRSVSLSIPCVVGPYTGIHARLELLGSSIRVSPDLSCSATQSHTSGASDAAAYECQSFASDTRFAHLYGTREAIATSSGLSDAGVFELNFRDERYLPFEFAGAVSRWRLELPPDNNAFDLATLTDVVVTLNFTAREGGNVLRRAASLATRARLPGDGYRLFDVQHEFADVWAMLKQSIRFRGDAGVDGARKGAGPPVLPLHFHRNMFPFLTGRRALSVVKLQLFIQAEEPRPNGAHIRVQYHASRYSHEEDGDEYHYGSSTREFDCVVHAEWPGLYHGVIDVEMEVPPTGRRESKACGTLRFPSDMFDIREAYVLCQYKVREVA